MAKTRAPRKSKKSIETPVEVPVQPTAAEPVQPVVPPAPVVSEAEQKELDELAAMRERIKVELDEARERYNREEIPKMKKRLNAAMKKLPKDASTEEVLKVFFDALNDGRPDVSW